jgi:transposase
MDKDEKNIFIGVSAGIVFLYVIIGGFGVSWWVDKTEERKEKDKEYVKSIRQKFSGSGGRKKTRKFK